MRNLLAWMRWLVLIVAVVLAVLFFDRVIQPGLEDRAPAPSPTSTVSPARS